MEKKKQQRFLGLRLAAMLMPVTGQLLSYWLIYSGSAVRCCPPVAMKLVHYSNFNVLWKKGFCDLHQRENKPMADTAGSDGLKNFCIFSPVGKH